MKNKLCSESYHLPLGKAGFTLSVLGHQLHIGHFFLLFCFIFFIGYVALKYAHLQRSKKYCEPPKIQALNETANKSTVNRSETVKSEFDRTKHTEEAKLIS